MPVHTRNRRVPQNEPYAAALMQAAVSSIGGGWHNLNGTEQSRFHALTLRLHPAPDGALPPGVNAFNTYSRLSHARFCTGRGPCPACPPMETAPALPDVTVAARWTDAGNLSLLLSADEPYPLPVALWGAKPILGGTTPAPSTRFVYIGFLPAGALGPAPFDAAPFYDARLSVRGAGWQIGLRLLGVTDGGFSSAEQFAWESVA